MNPNEKPDPSPEFLAKINKTVLRDVPGAEIISQEEAIQKDQEKYRHDLDEKGSAFPSFHSGRTDHTKNQTRNGQNRIEAGCPEIG